MSGARSSRAARVLQPLRLIAVLALVVSCRHWRPADGVPRFDPAPCYARGSDPVPKLPANPEAPIVCIDDRELPKLWVYPDPVHAKRGAAINWYTVTGQGSVAILFTNESPVKHLLCGPKQGFCHAVIDKDAALVPHVYGIHVVRAGVKGESDPTVQPEDGMTTIIPVSFEIQ